MYWLCRTICRLRNYLSGPLWFKWSRRCGYDILWHILRLFKSEGETVCLNTYQLSWFLVCRMASGDQHHIRLWLLGWYRNQYGVWLPREYLWHSPIHMHSRTTRAIGASLQVGQSHISHRSYFSIGWPMPANRGLWRCQEQRRGFSRVSAASSPAVRTGLDRWTAVHTNSIDW